MTKLSLRQAHSSSNRIDSELTFQFWGSPYICWSMVWYHWMEIFSIDVLVVHRRRQISTCLGAWWVIRNRQIRRAGKLTIKNGSHGKVIARLDVDSWDVVIRIGREHPVLMLGVISESVDAGRILGLWVTAGGVRHGGAGRRLW